ncbi:phage tail domain-containing protein [Jeotgalicoccus marinus]|uniref:phage tail domain-containing protein n=1 Tax=Jeotgalicoccus marinus TaxID=516700 RepID=UPI00042415F2|nr:phage tail domain-containing protein [Jeotgalicoccus marinus]
MSSGIKKRTGSEYSDGRPGRINYHSEDEYRTITLLVQSTAHDMQDIAHLRDAVNELFDGELMLREMRIKSVEVEYESVGQRTGELQLESTEYVNGKQIKVTMVNSPEVDDTTLVSMFTVEFETIELPYFETIYTTLELHDSGYSSAVEKYGLVDNIDDEKVKYRFTESNFTVYNAGNVTVEPESMYISLLFYYCSIPNGKMTVKNLTTGDTLIINSTENRRHIRQDGMVFTIGAVNRFRDTNRKFISLAPGDNRFEITGATFDEARIDFKYYYK